MKILRILFFMALCLIGFATHAEEVTYTVKAGDTLSRIALAYHTSVDALVEINTIADRDLIHPKQKLRINVSEYGVVAESQNEVGTSRRVAAVPSAQAVVAKAPLEQVGGKTNTIETSVYTCTLRSSGSPHCKEKAVLGQHEKTVSASVTLPPNSLPLGAAQGTSEVTLVDPPNIDTASAISFSVLQDLFPLSLNDTRTERRVSIRKFLRTYLGPPHDLARMEEILLNAHFPSPSPDHTVIEEKLKTKN